MRCEVRQEIKAAVAVAKFARTFVPLHYREEKQGKWIVAVPNGLLFPRYFFVSMPMNGPWGAISEADGVERVMCCRNRHGEPVPVPIPYREMRFLRTNHSAGERRREADRYKPGQKVKITGGAFAGFEGIFDKPEKDRLSILISIFGARRPVPVAEEDVRAA